MKIVLCIGLGGFFGAIARYGLNAGVHVAIGDRAAGFPVGTLVINVIGCFVLGFLAHFFLFEGFSQKNHRPHEPWS